MPSEPLQQSQVPGFPCRRGKVRDVYDLGETLAIVATDRISAFDYVLSPPIPEKGRILTALSVFWFDFLQDSSSTSRLHKPVPHHLLSTNLADLPPAFRVPELHGRTMLVKKTIVVPIECVARGYLAGSGWKEYKSHGTVCGIPLPPGLQDASRLPEPIFTPATKEEGGKHDENISFERMAELVGPDTAAELRDRTLDVYRRAAAHAEKCGIILADTKLEWGRLPTGELILIDEVLTPDSSRFWPQDTYEFRRAEHDNTGRPGASPPSFDKQFVRDWLETTDWDKASPPPSLPPDVVAKTAAKYREALDRLTGKVSAAG